MTIRLLTGDATTVLRTLPDRSVQCCITSPPYYGLRSYLAKGHVDKALEMGSEPTPAAFIAELVDVFREIKRVLRDDGTAWINLGDGYASSGTSGLNQGWAERATAYAGGGHKAEPSRVRDRKTLPPGMKSKDLLMIPARVAIALQADGWYLRSDIIWVKPNPMPESVTDRPTSSHEHIFLLTKRSSYYYDAESVREDSVCDRIRGPALHGDMVSTNGNGGLSRREPTGSRNLRNVWTIATMPYLKAHFATFPSALVERCIRAGTSERGACPSCAAPWVRTITKGDSDKAHRSASGSDKSGGYAGQSVKGHELSGVQNASDVKRRILEGMRLKTYSWRQTCDCPVAPPVPCTVIDPFSGAGTTCLVSSRLGRDAIGIDLNLVYTQMARERIEADAGMFDRVEAPAPPVPAAEKQASLWDVP